MSEKTNRQLKISNEYLKTLVDYEDIKHGHLKDFQATSNKTADMVAKELVAVGEKITESNDDWNSYVIKHTEQTTNIFTSIIGSVTDTIKTWTKAVVTHIPFVGKLFSDQMGNHLKSLLSKVWGEIKSEFKKHIDTILEPVKDIAGPVIAVGKHILDYGKKLLFGKDDKQSMMVSFLKKIYKVMVKSNKDEKKRWLHEKKEAVKKRAKDFFNRKEGFSMKGLFSAIRMFIVTVLSRSLGIALTILSLVMGTTLGVFNVRLKALYKAVIKPTIWLITKTMSLISKGFRLINRVIGDTRFGVLGRVLAKRIGLFFKFFTTLFNTGSMTDALAVVDNSLQESQNLTKIFTKLSDYTEGLVREYDRIVLIWKNWLTWVKDFGVSTGKTSSILTFLTKTWDSITDVFMRMKNYVVRIFDTVMDAMKLWHTNSVWIKRITKAFTVGFSKLALPLQILFSVFDFVTGFMKGYSEDGIMSGIREGLVGLFDGLIGSIVRLLKDIAVFGLELVGLDDFARSFSQYVDSILDGTIEWFRSAWDLFMALFTLDLDKIKAAGTRWLTAVGSLFESILSPLFYIMKIVKDWVSTKLNSVLKWFGFSDSGTDVVKVDDVDTPSLTSHAKSVAESNNRTAKAATAMSDKLEKATTALVQSNTQLTQHNVYPPQQQEGGGSDRHNMPADVESLAVQMNNSSWGLG